MKVAQMPQDPPGSMRFQFYPPIFAFLLNRGAGIGHNFRCTTSVVLDNDSIVFCSAAFEVVS